MERLTKRVTVEDRTFLTYVGKENPYEMELTIGEMQRKQIEHVMSRLEDWEKAEEQGLLVGLPVPVGSDVYKICPQSNHLKMGDMWDGRIITTDCQMCAWQMCDCYDIGYQIDRKNHIVRKMKAKNAEWLIKIKPYFGIIYFATEAEALQALQALKERE